jgi:hypothetical protein
LKVRLLVCGGSSTTLPVGATGKGIFAEESQPLLVPMGLNNPRRNSKSVVIEPANKPIVIYKLAGYVVSKHRHLSTN